MQIPLARTESAPTVVTDSPQRASTPFGYETYRRRTRLEDKISAAVRQQQDDHSPHPLRFRVKQPSPFGYLWQPTQDVYKFQSGHKEAAIWQTPGGAELNGSDTPLQRVPRPGEWVYRHAW